MSDTVETSKVGLSSPWFIYFSKLELLFKSDPAVKLVFDEENYVIKIYVENSTKGQAIESLLPKEKEFGNVTVKIEVLVSNLDVKNKPLAFSKAFEGNPILANIVSGELFGKPVYYFVFKKEVVQYYNDDLSDVRGVCSTLYQDLAKEIFGEDQNIFFCTNVDDNSVNK